MSRLPRPSRSGSRRGWHTVALVATLLIGMVIGANSPFAGADTNIDDTEAWVTFQEVWDTLWNQYVEPDTLDAETLIYGAIAGMVEAVGDTGHTSFTDPTEAALQDTSLRGEYVGIGISIDSTGARPVIVDVFEGSPAEQAGIEIGDVIREVNGIDVYGMRSEEVGSAFLTEDGEPVQLVLQRGDDLFDLELYREAIDIDEVKWWMIGDNIAQISYSSFVTGSADELAIAVDEAIDRRGTVHSRSARQRRWTCNEMLDVVGIFAPSGTPVQKIQYRNGSTEMLTVRNGNHFDFPLVILTSRSTASAAEVTTASLNEAGVATVIGEVTAGTGTGLDSVGFEDGSQLRYATVLWMTPSGESIWKVGYQPDFEVELDSGIDRIQPEDGGSMTLAEVEETRDAQLQAAIAFLLGGTVGD
ncbi:MAG: S41 family peptidase [Thermomicrobiales bacterium]